MIQPKEKKKTSDWFKFNGDLLVKRNDAILPAAPGSVALQQLSLIQCYINFSIYAAVVKYKALQHSEEPARTRVYIYVGVSARVWECVCVYVREKIVNVCLHPCAQKLLLSFIPHFRLETRHRIFIICAEFIINQIYLWALVKRNHCKFSVCFINTWCVFHHLI